MGNFNGMIEHVLSIAGAVFLTAQQLDDLRMQAVDSRFKGCPFTFGLDGRVYFFFGFFDHFLNAGRMDPSVNDEFFQGDPGDFAPDGIKT